MSLTPDQVTTTILSIAITNELSIIASSSFKIFNIVGEKHTYTSFPIALCYCVEWWEYKKYVTLCRQTSAAFPARRLTHYGFRRRGKRQI